MRLRALLAAAGVPARSSLPDPLIMQITDDSRRVKPGSLFVAVRGAGADGHDFAVDAAWRGAAAVLMEEPVVLPSGVSEIRVPSTRALLGRLAHHFYGAPSGRLRVVGVTGTKGKTTVAWLVQHLLSAAGLPCGLVGTVCHRIGDRELPSGNTTPGAVALQEMMARMAREGQVACAMEVSSHALDQGRTEGIRWSCGIFTNLAPEHLDYHGTVEKYLQAKLRLFRALPPRAAAIVNRDDQGWGRVVEASGCPAIGYSIRGDAGVMATQARYTMEGTSFRLDCREGSFAARSSLIGSHNLENTAAALAAVLSMGVPAEKALAALPEFSGVPGRLERIDCGQPFPVFVDYAHTDGSLARVLEQLKQLSGRKVLTLFGCGGDRDRLKRPRMGRVAAQLSDRVIVTSDNPRSERPAAIAAEIVEGMEGSGAAQQIILDRREAIRAALESADEGWVVLIAGKGHETTQTFDGRVEPFDDRVVAREFLESRRVVRV